MLALVHLMEWFLSSRKFFNNKLKLEKMMEEELTKKALELCYAIEELPASEQQTKIAVMASDLHGRLEKLVSQDFWRTFSKKLTKEYETVCIKSRMSEKDLDSTNYKLIKQFLEPVIDSFTKTFVELDDIAKNSG